MANLLGAPTVANSSHVDCRTNSIDLVIPVSCVDPHGLGLSVQLLHIAGAFRGQNRWEGGKHNVFHDITSGEISEVMSQTQSKKL